MKVLYAVEERAPRSERTGMVYLAFQANKNPFEKVPARYSGRPDLKEQA